MTPSSVVYVQTDLVLLMTTPPTTIFTTPIITPSSTPMQTSAPATTIPAASHGLAPGKLTAAIVVPIAFLAFMIPAIVFSCLGRRRRVEEREYARQLLSQRSSHKREYLAEKQQRCPAPNRPVRPEEQRTSFTRETLLPTTRDMLPPTTQQTDRHSLGLFNFEFSPPSSPSRHPRQGLNTPSLQFSMARALELRRSEVSVVESVHQSSAEPTALAESQIFDREYQQPMVRGNRHSSAGFYDPPPPYVSPRPSDALAQTSLFAPLERIGTQRNTDRCPHIVRQANMDAPLPNLPDNNNLKAPPQHNRASSGVLQSLDVYGRVRTRSDSSLSSSGVSLMSAHNNGPFSHGLPERLSDVSILSLDSSQWTPEHPRDSRRASAVSPIGGDEGSATHPHHLV
ncbi:hypothetical protein N7G274_008281 [Stereocaulon virgatum]|uniref:Uncharacterized protein n=1 Tax=Stereocaulon virgatum TaxID=373712 RepID=A0ABR4A1U3_9LECA